MATEFGVTFSGTFHCEGIHVDSTDVDKFMIGLIYELTEHSFAILEVYFDRGAGDYNGHLHMMVYDTSTYASFGRLT